jgi:dienelactone hydrolase
LDGVEDVDARDKRGHGESMPQRSNHSLHSSSFERCQMSAGVGVQPSKHLDFAASLRKTLRKFQPREELMIMLRMLAAVLAALFVFALSPAQAQLKTQWVEYGHGGMKFKAYMAHDEKATGKRPAVLMIHAREGMTPKTQQLTELWGKLGYVSFAADMFGYGQGILPKNVEEMQAQTAIFRKDPALTKARTQAALDTLLKQPMVDASKVALIGYCFGGDVGIVFGSAGAPLALNVAIHGSFGDYPAGWAKNAKGMYLILHGAEDPVAPLPKVDKVVQELRGAKVPFQLDVYSGTGHGFSTPKNKAEERANVQSIASTTRTLKELFGS